MSLICHDLTGAPAEAALRQAFSWSHPQILGYHHPAYQALLTIILDDSLHCLTVTRANDVCGIMPYRAAQTSYGTVLNAMPFFGCNGIVATSTGDDEVVLTLLKGFRERARSAEVFSATFYAPFCIDTRSWTGHLVADDVIVKFTQYIDLSRVTAWPVKKQTDLRRAAARGFSIRHGAPGDSVRIREIYSQNCLDARIPMKPPVFIEGTLAMAEQGYPRAPLTWVVAEHEGEIKAALLYGRGPLTGSYILPCAVAGERAHQPNSLLMDFAISECRRHGARYWNFESSPCWDDPVFKYKERWGAQARPFTVFVFYGSRGNRPDIEAIATVRRECPHYFTAPVGQITGTWPTHIPFPAP